MELWVSHTNKVHVRRYRFHVGTKDERPANTPFPIMLCGRRDSFRLAPDDAEITCLACLSGMGTGAHEEV